MNLAYRLKKASWQVRHAVHGDGQVQSPNGCTYRCTSWLERMRANTQMGEKGVIDRLRDHCRPDDIVWDVGANVGIVACPLASDLSAGRLIAFEPVPMNANRLETNLQLNARSDQWQVYRCCLGATTTTVELPIYDETVGAGGQSQNTMGTPIRTVTVRQNTGDRLIADNKAPSPSVLKLDVEGAEWDVLRGLESALSTVRFAAIEIHPNRLPVSPDTIHTTLRDAGFDVTEGGDRGSEYHLFATR